jgi:hypothetical protein
MRKSSTLRILVEQELRRRDTTFVEFLHSSLDSGHTINTAAAELARLTGIPLSTRTVYRWVEDLKVSA